MADRRQDPCVYICFMATMTTIAKISRRISGCDYTHISIAFDGKLEDFVSFSRRSANTPLDAGADFLPDKDLSDTGRPE